MTKTDEQIKREVEAELSWDPEVNATQVGVTVEKGAVALFGTVGTYGQKLAVERATRRVQGVRAVAEELSVKLAAPHERTDLEIAKAITSVLSWNESVPETVNAKVEQGWVTLHGSVIKHFQREGAERCIRHLHGVVGLTNLVEVLPQPVQGAVVVGVRAALARRCPQTADALQVDVTGARVTLTGEVASLRLAREARQAAWAAPGICDVVDAMTVSTGA